MSVLKVYKTYIDEASATITYIGKASTSALTSNAVWQIMKMEISGSITTITYADGDSEFNNIWDNRASLSYS